MTMNDTILLENRAYWTQRAPSYSEVNREELSTDRREAWKQVLVERIAARFPNREPDDIHVLEVGTGPGFFAILLAEAGYRVTAIDLTPSMLDEARRNAGKLCACIDFREMNAQNLAFDDESFDVIVSRNVTWNLPEPDLAYAEWVRVLKPGGMLMNFDANWYHYLCYDEARDAYAQDRETAPMRALPT
jgi:ubiquinone/menaquinone biosynthesis C-methylase UbiE